jgi:uncharacterized protein YndB with AHSA1/START domain
MEDFDMTSSIDTDRIVQTVTINSNLDRVWSLVTEPGWWVPTESPQPIDHTPGHQVVRASEKWGSFPVEVVRVDPKTYAAFRWASTFPGHDLADGNTTLVEFTVTPLAEGIEVTVTESGFARLDASDSVRKSGFDSNTSGWTECLSNLKTQAEQ